MAHYMKCVQAIVWRRWRRTLQHEGPIHCQTTIQNIRVAYWDIKRVLWCDGITIKNIPTKNNNWAPTFLGKVVKWLTVLRTIWNSSTQYTSVNNNEGKLNLKTYQVLSTVSQITPNCTNRDEMRPFGMLTLVLHQDKSLAICKID